MRIPSSASNIIVCLIHVLKVDVLNLQRYVSFLETIIWFYEKNSSIKPSQWNIIYTIMTLDFGILPKIPIKFFSAYGGVFNAYFFNNLPQTLLYSC